LNDGLERISNSNSNTLAERGFQMLQPTCRFNVRSDRGACRTFLAEKSATAYMTELLNRGENVLTSLAWSDGDFYEFAALSEYPASIVDTERLNGVEFNPGDSVSANEIARALFPHL